MSELQSILSHRGYSIAKKGVTPNVLSQYKSELTVMPHVEKEEYAFNIKPIKLYTETEKRFYMPRYYGTKTLGEPDQNKIADQKVDKINITSVLKPRDYQIEIIDKAMYDLHKIGGGVISLYCGAGKTIISLLILAKLGVKAMVVCHTTSLMQQWVERINQCFPTARIGIVQQGDAQVENVDIIIASLKTLALKDFGKDFFSTVGLVIWDEIHLMCTNTFSQAFPKCAVKYTLGLSATPFRKDRCDVIFQYFIGPVLYMLKRPKDNVIIAQCITLLVPEDEIVVKYDRRGKVMYTSTLSNVLYNQKRINRLVEIIIDHAVNGRKILVLGEYIQHLKEIMKRLIKRETEIHEPFINEKIGKIKKCLRKVTIFPEEIIEIITTYLRDTYGESLFTYGLYIGEMNNDERKTSEIKDVILGTYKLASVGMDIPHLNTLLMASPRKEIEQSVGRILRKTAGENDHKPLIIDIIDNHGVFSSQARTRKQFYKEYGYTIEHIRMEPVSGKVTSKRIVTTSAPEIDVSSEIESGQQRLSSFNIKSVPRVSIDDKKSKTKSASGDDNKSKNNYEIGDECLLESSEDE